MTLMEILTVVAVIAILATIVIGVAGRIQTHAKEQLTESTLAILNAALEQFRDYDFTYQGSYSGFDFPLDCNDFTASEVRTALQEALGLINPPVITGVDEPNYSGCEVMYFLLSRVPASREVLNKINSSLIAGKDSIDYRKITINDGGVDRVYPLLRVVDPWGKTLRYDYYNEDLSTVSEMEESKKNFPVVTSAGHDGIFETGDDITSR